MHNALSFCYSDEWTENFSSENLNIFFYFLSLIFLKQKLEIFYFCILILIIFL